MSIAFLDPGNSILLLIYTETNFIVAADLDAGNDGGYQLIWSLLLATIVGYFF